MSADRTPLPLGRIAFEEQSLTDKRGNRGLLIRLGNEKRRLGSFAGQEALLAQNRMPFAERDGLLAEIEERVVQSGPVDPADLVVLAIGVVVAAGVVRRDAKRFGKRAKRVTQAEFSS